MRSEVTRTRRFSRHSAPPWVCAVAQDCCNPAKDPHDSTATRSTGQGSTTQADARSAQLRQRRRLPADPASRPRHPRARDPADAPHHPGQFRDQRPARR
ncbi:hypothetical protein ACFPRL_18400 [Pseudoclavibacter helvolus]